MVKWFFKGALRDYEALEKSLGGSLEKSSKYNKLLCQAIIAAEANQLDSATKLFKTAGSMFPSKMEPYFYQAIIVLKRYLLKHKNIYSRKSDLRNCMKFLDICLERNDSVPGVHFARGIIFFALDYKNESIASLEKAIDKSDEIPPNYFYVRGLAYASSKCLKQAIQDLSAVLRIKNDY